LQKAFTRQGHLLERGLLPQNFSGAFIGCEPFIKKWAHKRSLFYGMSFMHGPSNSYGKKVTELILKKRKEKETAWEMENDQ